MLTFFLRRKKLQVAACIVWAAIVFVLHVMKVELESDRVRLFPHSDKVVHFTMFFVLAASFSIALSPSTPAKFPFRQLLLVFFCCVGYGAVLEYMQGTEWVQRDTDVLDWCADAVGSLCGIFVVTQVILPTSNSGSV